MSAHRSDEPESAPQMRQAATDHKLWEAARDLERSGDAKAQEIAAVCERIHRAATAEANRLISMAEGLSVHIEADSSGQLHLVEAHATTRDAARSLISLAVADGYVPWQTPENGAEEMFLRARNELTLVQLGDITHTLRVRWPESRLRQRVPSALMPSELDWNAVELPRAAWPAYFAVRPLRLMRNRISGVADTQLPLGPILSTPTDLLDELLVFAGLAPNDHLVDLGCGDGRVLVHAASTYGCRATGVERDPRLVVRARERINSAGLAGSVNVVEGDATTFDLGVATILFLFIPAEAVGSVVQNVRAQGFEGTIVSHEQRFVEGLASPEESTILVGNDSLTVAHRW